MDLPWLAKPGLLDNNVCLCVVVVGRVETGRTRGSQCKEEHTDRA